MRDESDNNVTRIIYCKHIKIPPETGILCRNRESAQVNDYEITEMTGFKKKGVGAKALP